MHYFLRQGCKDGTIPRIKSGGVYYINVQALVEQLGKRRPALQSVVTLTVAEPLASMKRLTEALEEHWKSMLHAAIAEAVRQNPFPYFNKAMVKIEIVTPSSEIGTGVLRGVSAWADATSRTGLRCGKRVCVGIDANPLSARTPYRMSARKVITNTICCDFWALNKL